MPDTPQADPAAFTAASQLGRNRRLTLGVVSGVGTRGAAFLITLISVPLTLEMLGQELYGVWVTVISLLAWLTMADVGLANGLTPALSAAFGRGREDLAREYIATAFWGLIIICLTVGGAVCVIWPMLDLGSFFKLRESANIPEVERALAIAIGLFLATMPFSINQRVLLAYQQGLAANLASLATSVAGLLGIAAAVWLKAGLVGLAVGYLGGQWIAAAATSIWLFGIAKPQLLPFTLPKWRNGRRVLSLGGLFFLSQIATMIVFQKDNILITQRLGAVAATPYSLTWQMFSYVTAMNLMVSPYLSPGFGEAYASRDLPWVRRAFLKYFLLTLGVALPAVVVLLAFHRSLLELWLGQEIRPQIATVAGMAVWTLILAALSPVVSLLVGIGRLKLYAILSVAASLLSLALTIWLLPIIGPAGAIIASCVSYSTLVLCPAFYEAWSVLGGDARRQRLSGDIAARAP
jgi:O-antigen/teichoic acid export membrane protein